MSRGRVDRGDRGSVATEMAIVAPVLFMLLMLVIFAGRVTDAQHQVLSAAHAAARAASLQGDEATAGAAAQQAAEQNLKNGGLTCTPADVDITAIDLGPDGTVSVSVSCTADVSNVALPGVPGSQTFTAESTEVVDRYRGTG
ncbi:MAG TPA: TadE family protein [Acidimicrobiales bacterium]|nr:TadE family protein [Acidimicrobiales bacterium]